MTILRHKTVNAILVGCFSILPQISLAHLPAYEGERVRNDNHFAKEGFAQPVRTDCKSSSSGLFDQQLGSARIYLGEQNDPWDFFCDFLSQDDWSFDNPINIIESTRTPGPDYSTLGLPLEEGYVPCSPTNPNPFQCPRIIRNPQLNSEFKLPGECIDLGQPDAGSVASEPDGVYHCALLSGSPRPRTSSVLFSTLTGKDDVDWAVYSYDPLYGEQPIVGSPQLPACQENINLFLSFGYAGPLTLKDSKTGKPLFVDPVSVPNLPAEVREKLPAGYGIRVTTPGSWNPETDGPRLGYASGYAQNGWLLAPESVVECIDSFEKCLADTTGELSKHYKSNDIFFVDEDRPFDLYLMWWLADESRQSKYGRKLYDVSITTGVVDQYLIGDYNNIRVTGPFAANGRYIHGSCRDPRQTGLVDIFIESN